MQNRIPTSHVRLLAERSREPLPSLAQAAERQNQLDAMVERLVRENGELRLTGPNAESKLPLSGRPVAAPTCWGASDLPTR